MNSNLKISVIGASSFLAKAIIKELEVNGENLLTLYYQQILQDLPINDKNLLIREYDFPRKMLDKSEIDYLLTQDAIIFCAGGGIQPDHQDNLKTIFEVNAFEPIRLINDLNIAGYSGQLITFGSYFEIGQDTLKKPYSESLFVEHSNRIANDYALSKRILTHYISTRTNPNTLSFDHKHLILTNIYGNGENPVRLIPYILQNIMDNREIRLTAGTQLRQYTNVRDVAFNLIKLLETRFSGIMNFTDNNLIQVRDLVEKTVRIGEEFTGNKAKTIFSSIDKRDTSMDFLALDNSLAVQQAVWKTTISIEEGIREYLGA